MTLILFIITICVALIFLGISNYKYFIQEHVKDHPKACQKRRNAILLISISSALGFIGLAVIILLAISLK
jgi:amino acid permease